MNLVDEEWQPAASDAALLRRVRAAVKAAVSPADVARLRALLLAPPMNGAVPHEARGTVWLLLLGLRPDELLAEDASDFARAAREAVSDDNAADQIGKDVERTRPGLARFKQPAVRGALLRLLSLFCERTGVRYTQGLNELLAPFVLLADTGGNPRLVYALFSSFLTRFAPWMLDSSELRVFDVLKRSFKYFGRLLLYHDPELYWHLEHQMMTPDLYATSWFVTLFARNFTVETVLALWDLLLLDDNPLGTCFFGLALLTSRRKELLSCDPARLPETLMMLGASTPDEVRDLWKLSNSLRAVNTPPSFQRLMFNRLLAQPASPTSAGLAAARFMQASFCLQVTPDDLSVGEAKYFTWDCRTRGEFASGHLAQAAFLPLDALRASAGGKELSSAAQQELDEALKLCQPLRSTTHICLVGTGIKEEDDTDVNLLARFLSEKGVPYVSTLRGGFHAAAASAREDDALFSVELVDFDEAAHEAAMSRRVAASTARAHRRALAEVASKAMGRAASAAQSVASEAGSRRESLSVLASSAATAVSSAASSAAAAANPYVSQAFNSGRRDGSDDAGSSSVQRQGSGDGGKGFSNESSARFAASDVEREVGSTGDSRVGPDRLRGVSDGTWSEEAGSRALGSGSEQGSGWLNRGLSELGSRFSTGFTGLTAPAGVGDHASREGSTPTGSGGALGVAVDPALSSTSALEEFSSIVTLGSGSDGNVQSPHAGFERDQSGTNVNGSHTSRRTRMSSSGSLGVPPLLGLSGSAPGKCISPSSFASDAPCDVKSLGGPTLPAPSASGSSGSIGSRARRSQQWVAESPRPGAAYGSRPPHSGDGDLTSSSNDSSGWKKANRSSSLFGASRSPWGREARPGWIGDESLGLPLSEMPKGFTVNVMDDRVMAGLKLFPCRARSDRSNPVRSSKLGEFKRRYVGVCSNYFMLLSPHPSRSHLLEVKLIRFLQDIARITFKRSRPELVTFEVLGPVEQEGCNEHIVCIMPDGLSECVDLIKEYLGQHHDHASAVGSEAQAGLSVSRKASRDQPANEPLQASEQAKSGEESVSSSGGSHTGGHDGKQSADRDSPGLDEEWSPFQMSLAMPTEDSADTQSRSSSCARSPPPYPMPSPPPYPASPPPLPRSDEDTDDSKAWSQRSSGGEVSDAEGRPLPKISRGRTATRPSAKLCSPPKGTVREGRVDATCGPGEGGARALDLSGMSSARAGGCDIANTEVERDGRRWRGRVGDAVGDSGVSKPRGLEPADGRAPFVLKVPPTPLESSPASNVASVAKRGKPQYPM